MALRRIAATVVGVALAVAAVGCSSDGGSDGTTSMAADGGQTTTTPSAAGDPAYAEAGPNPVGTRTIALDDGRRVVAWYPAAETALDQPTEVFDIASLLTPELQAKIPADLRPQYEIGAHPGADPASGGPFPVVLFSHGYAGFPEQSADLVTHLASWGFVVVAPDHVERSLSGLLGNAAKGVDPRTDEEVLGASLDAALADDFLSGLIDAEQVAVAGHSAGAAAAYRMAATDERVKAFISYSVHLGDDEDQVPVPKVPGMVMLGDADQTITADENRAVYDGMDPPKYLLEIADAGHLVFSDICEIGKDEGGIVGLVHQVGLDIPDDLLSLASDGCQDDALDPPLAFGAIDHFSVAFLRHALGVDPDPVGLDQATADEFADVGLTFTADPG